MIQKMASARIGWFAATVFACIAGAILLVHLREKSPEQRPIRLQILPPGRDQFIGNDMPVLSPDGSMVVFSSTSPPKRLFVRSLDLRYGLLSTTALLDLFEIAGDRREQLESNRREKSEVITHAEHGKAILRDQQPMNEAKLKKALRGGLSPRDWYRFLNRKVFFWGPKSRLRILRGARLYEAHPQTIIEIDTARFLERYADRVSLCHINSGATQPMAWERGTDTFVPLEEYPLAERRKRYGVNGAVAEVTVEYSVPDLQDFVVRAYLASVGGVDQVLWPPQEGPGK